jgi:two-component system, OmpR family, response regulator
MPKILVVDDDAHIRQMVCFALGKSGFATVEAAHGRAALDLFARERPDLVILDILMPEMDGTEVCRRLRRGSATPIIFLSSKEDEVDRIIGLELGGDDYVTRDAQPVVLPATECAILRTLIGRPGKVFTRENLMDSAYDDHRYVSDRTIDSHVRRLRGKLAAVGAAPIETVHGIGYKLVG